MESISTFRKKRKERIDDILGTRNDIDDNSIIKRLEQYWENDLKDYKFISDCKNIKKGKFIKYISLDLQTIKSGLVVNIEISRTKYVNKLILHNLEKKWYWKIDPHKYYIYANLTGTNNFFRNILEQLQAGKIKVSKEEDVTNT